MPLGDAVDRTQGGIYPPYLIGGYQNPWQGQGNLLDATGDGSTPDDAPYDSAPPYAGYGSQEAYNSALAKAQGNTPDESPNAVASEGTPASSTSSATTNSSKGGLNTFGGFNLPGIALSLYETIKSQQGLDQLNKTPFPEYSVSPELRQAYGQAQSLSNQGYTPQERAAFMSQMGQGSATNSYYASQKGGANLANAIQGAVNAQSLNSYNQFAGQDAQLHRQNIAYAGQMAGQIQGQQNLQTQADIQRRNMLEQAYGGGLQTGLSGLSQNLNGGGTLGNLLNAGVKIAEAVA